MQVSCVRHQGFVLCADDWKDGGRERVELVINRK